MEFDQVRTRINRQLLATAGRELSAAESALLSAAWNGRTYEEESRLSGYSLNYLQRDIGPRFWRLLSEIFNRQINKTTFRAVALSELASGDSPSADSSAESPQSFSQSPDATR